MRVVRIIRLRVRARHETPPRGFFEALARRGASLQNLVRETAGGGARGVGAPVQRDDLVVAGRLPAHGQRPAPLRVGPNHRRRRERRRQDTDHRAHDGRRAPATKIHIFLSRAQTDRRQTTTKERNVFPLSLSFLRKRGTVVASLRAGEDFSFLAREVPAVFLARATRVLSRETTTRKPPRVSFGFWGSLGETHLFGVETGSDRATKRGTPASWTTRANRSGPRTPRRQTHRHGPSRITHVEQNTANEGGGLRQQLSAAAAAATVV